MVFWGHEAKTGAMCGGKTMAKQLEAILKPNLLQKHCALDATKTSKNHCQGVPGRKTTFETNTGE